VVTINGLASGTRYTVFMQAGTIKDGAVNTLTKGTSMTASTAAIAAVRSAPQPQHTLGVATIGWMDNVQRGAPTGDGVTYDVGVWIGNAVFFSKAELEAFATAATTNAKNRAVALAMIAAIGDQLESKQGITDRTAKFTGVTQNWTYAVRSKVTGGSGAAGATFKEGDTVSSTIAKIAVKGVRYNAPKTLTQISNTMAFIWTKPNDPKSPIAYPPAAEAAVTYLIGVYDTKNKVFVGTPDVKGADSPLIQEFDNEVKDKTIAVVQVLTFADGSRALSVAKTVKVK